MISKLKIRALMLMVTTICCCGLLSAQNLKEQAEAGDKDAQYKYAYSLLNGVNANSSSTVNSDREQQAFQWFLKAAEQGHVKAQLEVGYSYGTGRGTTKDRYKAFSWYQKSANQNNEIAIYNMGLYYENGYGVVKSPTKAFDYYKKSADLGYSSAKRSLARCYNRGIGTQPNYKEAFKIYSELADDSDVHAEYELANMYLKGIGVEKDTVAAVEWLLHSAGGGYVSPHQIFGYNQKEANKDARNKLISLSKIESSEYKHLFLAYLGCLFESEANYAEAEKAYKEAIDNYSAMGVIKLGLMYFYLEANDEQQHYYMDDYTEGNGLLGLECWKYKDNEQTAANIYLKNKRWSEEDNSVYWLEKAVGYGYGNFPFGAMPYTVYEHLLFCYNDGIGNHKDIEKAIDLSFRCLSDEKSSDWYHFYMPEAILTASLENQQYSARVFDIYNKLYDLVKDPKSNYSSEVLKIASAGLGKAYYKGLGTPKKDYTNAFKFLTIASDLNDSESMRLLAACYRYGRGVQRDANKEKEWLDKAVKHRDDRAVELANRLMVK
jgi:TPR repeat protein